MTHPGRMSKKERLYGEAGNKRPRGSRTTLLMGISLLRPDPTLCKTSINPVMVAALPRDLSTSCRGHLLTASLPQHHHAGDHPSHILTSAKCECSERPPSAKQEGAHAVMESSGILVLNFSISRAVRNQHHCLSHPVCGSSQP